MSDKIREYILKLYDEWLFMTNSKDSEDNRIKFSIYCENLLRRYM